MQEMIVDVLPVGLGWIVRVRAESAIRSMHETRQQAVDVATCIAQELSGRVEVREARVHALRAQAASVLERAAKSALVCMKTQPVSEDDDKVDIPEESLPYVAALAAKMLLLCDEVERLRNTEHHWQAETFALRDDVECLQKVHVGVAEQVAPILGKLLEFCKTAVDADGPVMTKFAVQFTDRQVPLMWLWAASGPVGALGPLERLEVLRERLDAVTAERDALQQKV